MEKIQINSLLDLLHEQPNDISAQGFFTSNTHTLLGNVLLFFMGIPKTKKEKGNVLLKIENKGDIKIWKRYFNNKLFKTYCIKDCTTFIEKQGIISFEFELKETKNQVEYIFKSMKIGKIKLPKSMSLQPYGISYIKGINSWFFDIRIYFLFTQPLIRYQGIVSLVNH